MNMFYTKKEKNLAVVAGKVIEAKPDGTCRYIVKIEPEKGKALKITLWNESAGEQQDREPIAWADRAAKMALKPGAFIAARVRFDHDTMETAVGYGLYYKGQCFHRGFDDESGKEMNIFFGSVGQAFINERKEDKATFASVNLYVGKDKDKNPRTIHFTLNDYPEGIQGSDSQRALILVKCGKKKTELYDAGFTASGDQRLYEAYVGFEAKIVGFEPKDLKAASSSVEVTGEEG